MSRIGDASPELLAILSSLCDETAGQADLDQLERLVGANRESMILLLDYVQLHSDLQMEIASRKCSDIVLQNLGLTPIANDAASTDSHSVVEPTVPWINTLGKTLHGMVTYFSHEIPFSFLIAALLLGTGLLIAALTSVPQPIPLAQQPIPDNVAWTPETRTQFVGRITGMVNCQWADVSTAAFHSAYVPLGRKYSLASGLMEITYNTGDTVILQGPATYEVDSDRGGFLSVGKLTALIEKSGDETGERDAADHESIADDVRQSLDSQSPAPRLTSPAPPFAIRTPTVTVTDLGTEFGVEVARSGVTESHVFRGKAMLQLVDGNLAAIGDEVLLVANESARVEKPASDNEKAALTIHRGVATPECFVRAKQFVQLTPRGTVTWQLPTQVGGVNDIQLNGTLVHAGHWAGWNADNHKDIDVTVRAETIRFALRPNNAPDDWASIKGGHSYSPAGLFAAPPGFDPSFARVLGGFAQNWDVSLPVQTLTLRKLTPGRMYQIQLFTADDRGGARRIQSWSDSATHRNRSATFCNGGVSNPPSEPLGAVSLIGTFTATSSSIRLYGNGGGVGVKNVSALNAYVLRDVTPADK